jgi:hypothetical protein
MANKQLTVQTERLRTVQQNFDKTLDAKEQQEQKIEEWKYKVQEIEEQAEGLGINIEEVKKEKH